MSNKKEGQVLICITVKFDERLCGGGGGGRAKGGRTAGKGEERLGGGVYYFVILLSLGQEIIKSIKK